MNHLSRATLAAGAIKLGGFAAFNAEASIVETTLSTPVVINNNQVSFDINSDGIDDIMIFHQSLISVAGDGLVNAIVAASGSIAGTVSYALSYAPGALIDASATYKGGLVYEAYNTDNPSRSGNIGYWANGGADPSTWPGADQAYRGYLGLSFLDAASAVHYAWVDLDVSAYNATDLSSYQATVYGYAYETVAGVGIPAGVPEPGSLALLALGAAGFMTRRRRAQQLAA